MMVKSGDKPHDKSSDTNARTELSFKNYVYSSGTWEFSGDFYVPKSSNGFTIFQIFNEGKGSGDATSLMINIFKGDLTVGQGKFKLLDDPRGSRYHNLRVRHNYDNGNIDIWVNGEKLHSTKAKGRGGPNRFKCGVYSKDGMSKEMHVYWANLDIKQVSRKSVADHHHHHELE